MTTKEKLQRCFELALQIPGASFSFNPDAECISVYSIKDDNHVFSYDAYYSYLESRLDDMIVLLQSHINEQGN